MEQTEHILIVVDDADIRSLLTRLLQKNGLHATAVADGGAMWRALDESCFDLLVLDRLLPGDDGLTLCRMLRATSDLPVLMLSAHTHAADRSDCLSAGADGYLNKPFSPRELLACIQALRGSCGLRWAHAESGR